MKKGIGKVMETLHSSYYIGLPYCNEVKCDIVQVGISQWAFRIGGYVSESYSTSKYALQVAKARLHLFSKACKD